MVTFFLAFSLLLVCTYTATSAFDRSFQHTSQEVFEKSNNTWDLYHKTDSSNGRNEEKLADNTNGKYTLKCNETNERTNKTNFEKVDGTVVMKNVSHAICKDIGQIAVPPLPSSYTCQLLNSCIETDFTGEPPTATVKFAAALPKEFISVVSRSAPNAGTEHLLKFDRVKNISQKWTFLPGTWALIFMYTASNAGHVLGDEVWPAKVLGAPQATCKI